MECILWNTHWSFEILSSSDITIPHPSCLFNVERTCNSPGIIRWKSPAVVPVLLNSSAYVAMASVQSDYRCDYIDSLVYFRYTQHVYAFIETHYVLDRLLLVRISQKRQQFAFHTNLKIQNTPRRVKCADLQQPDGIHLTSKFVRRNPKKGRNKDKIWSSPLFSFLAFL